MGGGGRGQLHHSIVTSPVDQASEAWPRRTTPLQRMVWLAGTGRIPCPPGWVSSCKFLPLSEVLSLYFGKRRGLDHMLPKPLQLLASNNCG